MRISSDGCEPCQFDTQPAVTHWLRSSARCRRPTHKPYKPREKKSSGTSLDSILENDTDTVTEEIEIPAGTDSDLEGLSVTEEIEIPFSSDSDTDNDRDFEGFTLS